MIWQKVKRTNKAAARLADRHYSRQTPGAQEFTPPGRVLVLTTFNHDAVWATSWPYAEFVNRAYKTAWLNCIFRNESNELASRMIREAVAITRWFFGDPPDDGMITIIDQNKVKPIKRRGRLHWGYVYERAGFAYVGDTIDKKLMIFQLLPSDMPKPEIPINGQLKMAI